MEETDRGKGTTGELPEDIQRWTGVEFQLSGKNGIPG